MEIGNALTAMITGKVQNICRNGNGPEDTASKLKAKTADSALSVSTLQLIPENKAAGLERMVVPGRKKDTQKKRQGAESKRAEGERATEPKGSGNSQSQ